MSSIVQTRHASADSAAPLRTRIISRLDEWSAIEPAWRDLFANSPVASPPLHWEWLSTWWRVFGRTYGAENAGLRIIVAERNKTLVAALPLYVARRSTVPFSPRPLQFISTGESRLEETCPQYMDALYRVGHDDAVSALMDAVVTDGTHGWDQLNLVGLSQNSLLNQWRAKANCRIFDVADSEARPSFVADLSGGIDAYFERLSANSRAQARRLIRAVKSRGVDFDVCTRQESCDVFYDQMVALHQARWNQAGLPGCFSSARFTEFHRSLARELIGEGTAILARLSYQGEPLALLQGYVHDTRFHHYLGGVKLTDDAVVQSPGIAAHLLLKLHLIERGVTEYDYLPGHSRYKEQYSTDRRSMCQLTANRRSLRSVAHRIALTGARATRKVVNTVRKKP
jgi:CelD/BcsL family acetyltransferase involved in cellulose biosynthesis